MFSRITPPSLDPIMQINAAYRADTSENKLDLGLGVYKNRDDITPVYKAVKAAEEHLLSTQQSKAYLSPLGDLAFVEKVSNLLVPHLTYGQNVVGAQTAGGTGAVRIAMETAKTAGCTRVWIPDPTWGNHLSIAKAIGLEVRRYAHSSYTLAASATGAIEDLQGAQPNDAIVVHACCHNPTGIDYTREEAERIIETIKSKQLLPVIDSAYFGFGRGLDEDMWFARKIIAECPESLIAVSFSKNMGLYRDRVGACLAVSDDATAIKVTEKGMATLARAMYSMPPDHGAAVAGMILGDAALTAQWQNELEEQRLHVFENRQRLCLELVKYGADFDNSYISAGTGMFCLLPLKDAHMVNLREEHSLYLGPKARVNLAALHENTIERFARLIAEQSQIEA